MFDYYSLEGPPGSLLIYSSFILHAPSNSMLSTLYRRKERRSFQVRFFFLQLIECLFFLKFETFEEVIHNGIHLGQSWWQNKEAFGWQDETVKRKLLCYMRSSSNFTSDTSCAILHKSLSLTPSFFVSATGFRATSGRDCDDRVRW